MTHKSLTRTEAKASGSMTYYTGPCPFGHTCGRYVSSGVCVECHRKRCREDYRKSGPARTRDYRARKNGYSPAPPEKDFPPRPQDGRCECRGEYVGADKLVPDHDHKTGHFRGWICFRCNSGIGLLGDMIEGVSAAADYLRRHDEKPR